MPSGDAVQKRPTVDEQVAQFKSYATNNGQVITKENPENLNPITGKPRGEAAPETKKEDAPATKDGKAAAKPAAPVKLSDEESEAVITALDKELGREATEAEIAAALKKATDAKNPGAKQKPKRSVQERINDATKKQRQAERRAATAEAERDALRAQIASGRPAADKAPLTGDTKKAKDDDAPPDPSKFQYGELDAGYIRAVARYEAKQELAAQSEKDNETRLTAEQQRAKREFEDKRAAFEEAGGEKFEDFHEVVFDGAYDERTNPRGWPMSNELGMELLESDHGPDIAYKLASDLKLAREIFELPVRKQLAWLGRQEAELSAGTGATTDQDEGEESEDQPAEQPTSRKVSKAPAPVPRARGQGSNNSGSVDSNDFAAVEAKWRAEHRRR